MRITGRPACRPTLQVAMFSMTCMPIFHPNGVVQARACRSRRSLMISLAWCSQVCWWYSPLHAKGAPACMWEAALPHLPAGRQRQETL